MSDDPSDDPSDWLASQVPQTRELDSMLRCQICKGFLRAPVVTPCGHVFCSICIREALTDRNQCPLCLEELFEGSLRKVLLLDGIVGWFKSNRGEILEKLALRSGRKDEEVASDVLTSDGVGDSVGDSVGDTIGDSEGSASSPIPGAEMTECPVCLKKFTVEELQNSTHIDECLNRKSTPSSVGSFFGPPKKRAKVDTTHQMQTVRSRGGPKSGQRIPMLDTTITVTRLREKAASYGVSTSGTRPQLEARMKQYINLHNANLDALHPVDNRVLLSRLGKWEARVRSHAASHQNHEEKSQVYIDRAKRDSADWRQKNESAYKDLIRRARANMKGANGANGV